MFLYWHNLASYSTHSVLRAVTDEELVELWQVGVGQAKSRWWKGHTGACTDPRRSGRGHCLRMVSDWQAL